MTWEEYLDRIAYAVIFDAEEKLERRYEMTQSITLPSRETWHRTFFAKLAAFANAVAMRYGQEEERKKS